ncbi:AraC family transcriptional regulator [Pseudomonas sp.]|uniref:AraC family transcriptional regulator n=1 Tax=Pseudomonas sp. TaxID=306 RepID=UPI00262459F7|nr:AraC family transcriptional regulator [Pseudomonas sp.]
MKEKHSVSSYFAKVLLYSFGEQPLSIQRLLGEAGIIAGTLNELPVRVSAKEFSALWLAVVQARRDEFFGLDSHGMPLGSFALICRGLIQAPSVEKALSQSLAYFQLFLRDVEGEVVIRDKRRTVVLRYTGANEYLRAVVTETFLVLIVGLMCWLAGRRIHMTRVRFDFPPPGHGDEQLLWGSDVVFNASSTEIELDPECLRLPISPDRASLYTFLRNAPQSVFIRFRNREGYSARVHQRLQSCSYDLWPTLEQLAVEFALSLSSLRRALTREGFSYQQIKDDMRRSIAFERLRDTSMSIADIAQEVGFREPSAFHRAFKQWTGLSPGAFRQQRGSAI